MGEINGADTKDMLKELTTDAVKNGATGAPYMVVKTPNNKPMVFFGSDRFEQMAFTLGKPWHGPQPNRATAKL